MIWKNHGFKNDRLYLSWWDLVKLAFGCTLPTEIKRVPYDDGSGRVYEYKPSGPFVKLGKPPAGDWDGHYNSV